MGTNKKEDIFKGKFVVLTVYALLEKETKQTKLKRSSSLRNQLKTFITGKEPDEDVEFRRNAKERRSANRISFNNRRTVGAVTYNLEEKYFILNLKNNCVGTPDIWRPVQEIGSGIQHESVSTFTTLICNKNFIQNDNFEVNLSQIYKHHCGVSATCYQTIYSFFNTLVEIAIGSLVTEM